MLPLAIFLQKKKNSSLHENGPNTRLTNASATENTNAVDVKKKKCPGADRDNSDELQRRIRCRCLRNNVSLVTITKEGKAKQSEKKGGASSDSRLLEIPFEELQAATDGFNSFPVTKKGCFLGSGRFGDVYRGRLQWKDKPVAVKKFKPVIDKTDKPNIYLRFLF